MFLRIHPSTRESELLEIARRHAAAPAPCVGKQAEGGGDRAAGEMEEEGAGR